jgi:hypothetical protein
LPWRWGILLARQGGRPVGGAGVYSLDRFQRPDMAVLWDIRVVRPGRVILLQVRCTPGGWQAIAAPGEALDSPPRLEG